MNRYLKPQMVLKTIELHEFITTSPLIEVSDNNADPDQESLSNGRRANWGDLWHDE